MTTPQWTIDFNRVIAPDGVDCLDAHSLTDSNALARRVAAALNEALVADVAAARLVDDMAAVIQRLLDGWRTGERRAVVEAGAPRPDPVPIWMHGGAKASDYDSEPMSPGEVAALHHVRQQEETPCPTCQGDGFIEADEGDPVFDPEDRCADCPTCGGSGEVAALHHVRQQEES